MKRAHITGISVFVLAVALVFTGCEAPDGPAASDEKSITGFSIGEIEGVITGNVIIVTIPAGTDITRLSPTVAITGSSVSPESGAERNFSTPVIYTVTADDASTQTYAVIVIVQGKASITIEGPGEEDIILEGFTGEPVLSRSGKNGLPGELTLSVSDTYTFCAWYINGVPKSGDADHDSRITIMASDYALKKHYITVVIYKTGIPYSREFTFTVSE